MANNNEPTTSNVGFFVGLGMVVVALILAWLVFGDNIQDFITGLTGGENEVAEATPTPGTFNEPFDFEDEEATNGGSLAEEVEEEILDEDATVSGQVEHDVNGVDAGLADISFGEWAVIFAGLTLVLGLAATATEKTYWLDR